MIRYFKNFIFISILLLSTFSDIFAKKTVKTVFRKKITIILYRIGSIGAGLLILFYFLLEEYAPKYIDNFFYWLWIPALCLCFLLIIEARYQVWNRILYYAQFLGERIRRLMVLVLICLGISLVSWYSICLEQRIFLPEHYQLVTQEEKLRMSESRGNLRIPWVVEGEYVTTRNKRDECIVSFSKKRLYFQYYSRKQFVGSQLHLEMLHYGKWYRLKEKGEAELKGTKISERQWMPLSAEEYYEIDLNSFERVVPGYYRIRMTIEDRGYIDTYFWLK